jgi:hypothetical protein
VPYTMTSAAISSPPASRIPSGVMRSMPSVTSRTLSRLSADAHTPLSRMMRLDPGG